MEHEEFLLKFIMSRMVHGHHLRLGPEECNEGR